MNNAAFQQNDKIQVLAWTGHVISDGVVKRASADVVIVQYHYVADSQGSTDVFELQKGTWVLRGDSVDNYPTTLVHAS